MVTEAPLSGLRVIELAGLAPGTSSRIKIASSLLMDEVLSNV
jgi:hypothetical protein